MSYVDAVSSIVAHIRHLPGADRLRSLVIDDQLEESTLSEIVGAAGKFAADVIEPFNRTSDAAGCRLESGRVVTAPGQADAWRRFVEGGWPTIEAPSEFGGAGLPLVVHSGCEELFNRASAAFGMLATPTRCAVRLIHKYGDRGMQAEWLPRLTSGEWGGAICISEADAGSDVGRVRTLASPAEDGSWSITGEKMWISFGDHDLTSRIGYMLLARTPGAPAGTGGLSLFLVPASFDESQNGVFVRRLEEKLGLHASPTCALGFEDARGWLVGTLHRGLSQLFTMIVGMRISVGSQGAGLAGAASDLAWEYAAERRQGGAPTAPAVAIDSHGDVRRMLLEMAARAEVARGLVLLSSLTSGLADLEDNVEARGQAASLVGWLLPITKNFCAEAAFINASDTIQVLGGAGYTREWPAEQYLRDARVLSIYEGTTGMQALDLLMRRALGDGQGFHAFSKLAQDEIARSPSVEHAKSLQDVFDLLQEAVAHLRNRRDTPLALQAGATPFLRLASLATTGVIALRLASLGGEERLAGRGRHWLRLIPAAAAQESALIFACDHMLDEFAAAR